MEKQASIAMFVRFFNSISVDLVLNEIWIYPVKSLGGIRMATARVLDKGLEFDRRYMLIDDDNNFMTQRSSPTMALFKLSFAGDSFNVEFGNESIKIPQVPVSTSGSERAKVWNDEVEVELMSEEFHRWFSTQLNVSCRLAFFPEPNSRQADVDFAKNDEQVSLADAYPFLIIGKMSLEELNARLDSPVPMNRFRPNFVFEGGRPFEEDSWRNFSIGSNRFVGLKPCARCVMTTVNQETGEKGVEPLATLSTYRRRDGKVYFGQNLIAVDHGEVREGDVIKIESYH